MNFHPDLHNAGGRKTITDYMVNHYSTLFHAKAAVNSHVPPHPHVDAGKPKKPGKQQELGEQIEGFRRAKQAKEGPSRTVHTDLEHHPPDTFNLATQLSQAKSKRLQAQTPDHLLEIKHLQRRINAVGSVPVTQLADRKKNIYDPVAYPPVLYKRAGSAKASSSRSEDPASLETPHVGSGEQDPGTELKRQLLAILIAQRWTEDEQLSELYSRTREAHRHLEEAVVEDAIAFVQYSLDHSGS